MDIESTSSGSKSTTSIEDKASIGTAKNVDAECCQDSISAEIAKLTSQLAYAQADLDNYKKRFQREKDNAVAKASESLANDIFPIVDSFEMAVETLKMSKLDGSQPVLSGMQIVMSQLEAALEKHGFEKVGIKVGNAFDVNLCEAVSSEESQQAPGTVARVFCSGWLHNGKLVRPAKVAVAK